MARAWHPAVTHGAGTACGVVCGALSVAGRSVATMTASTTAAGPAEFLRAVARLDIARLRTEVEIGPLPAPARLAPWSHALSATLYPAGSDEEMASGRMILLFDPDGVDAWGGSLRIVVFATCELDTEIAQDPLLPEVAWSWLTESLGGQWRRLTAHSAGR